MPAGPPGEAQYAGHVLITQLHFSPTKRAPREGFELGDMANHHLTATQLQLTAAAGVAAGALLTGHLPDKWVAMCRLY